jgi:tol-pal system protein YbgF
MRRSGCLRWVAISTLSLGAGCVSAETAEQRQLESMEKGIEQDRFAVDKATPRVRENDDATEAKRPGAAPSQGSSTGPAEDGAPTQLDLANSAASVAAAEDPADMTPRTVIRIWGGGKGPPSVQVSETAPRASAKDVAAASPVSDGASKRAYDAALGLVNAHAYQEAAGALGTFLLQWPDDPNASNAIYWQAECYYSMGEYSRAAEQLEQAIARYPKSPRLPDCLLKLGLCQRKLGDEGKAQSYFQRLETEFPRSEAARRIPKSGAPGG